MSEAMRYGLRQKGIPYRFATTAQFKARVYDWDGDGLPDLVDVDSAFGPRGILVFANTGTRSEPGFAVETPSRYEICPGHGYGERHMDARGHEVWEHYYGFEVVDWNRDGLPDFLAGGIILHLNVGTRDEPRFEYRGPIQIGGKPYPYIGKYTIAVFADLDGDGRRDLLISSMTAAPGDETGPSWSPGAKQIYEDSAGPGWDVTRTRWPVPRLHFCKNVGDDADPRFETIEEVSIDGEPAGEFIHAWAMPEAVDWSGDGFADLILGDTSRCIRYFRNLRTAGTPRFETASLPLAEGFERLQPDHIPGGMPNYDHPVCPIPRHIDDAIAFELPVAWLRPNAVDWDGDGDLDLVISANDHSLWIVENVGTNEAPLFASPGRLTWPEEDSERVPVAVDNVPVPQIVDWDGDGRPDLMVGGEQGRIHFFANLGGRNEWKFKAPEALKGEDGREIWLADICDGYFHGIWCPGAPITSSDFFGYVEPTFVDLDGDGDLDIVLGDISLSLKVIENAGTRTQPVLRAPYELTLNGRLYQGGWRCRPAALDIDGDGIVEIVHPARDGVFHIYRAVRESGRFVLSDDRVLHSASGEPVRLRTDGQRQHLRFADWDGDGLFDLLVGYINHRVIWLRNVGTNQVPRFEAYDLLPQSEEPLHDCGADACDWYGAGKMDLIVGTEWGWLRIYRHDEIRPVPLARDPWSPKGTNHSAQT